VDERKTNHPRGKNLCGSVRGVGLPFNNVYKTAFGSGLFCGNPHLCCGGICFGEIQVNIN